MLEPQPALHPNQDTVWIIDDDQSIRWVLEKALQRQAIIVRSFTDADQALQAINDSEVLPQAMFCDVRMPGTNGFEFVKILGERLPGLPVIIMTAYTDLDSAVSSFDVGAFEYLPKPFDLDEAVGLCRRACQAGRARHQQHTEISAKLDETTPIIGEAPAMQEVFRAIGRLARSQITVLINGESGTGKELVASALHTHSPRRNGPFVALNMAAIPTELMESELFGHEKGAFTGANQQRQGRFEQAHGGTLFLDEIGDMPAALQTRLLRVLAEGQFFRVGGHQSVEVDVRIIAATHQDLYSKVARGDFREDFFHRLNVIRLQLPALRDRREDIPLLLQHFLQHVAQELGVESKTLRPETMRQLCALSWPGNVRQLENVARWLTVMASGRWVELTDLPEDLWQSQTPLPTSASIPIAWEQALQQWARTRIAAGEENLMTVALPIFERVLLEAALQHTQPCHR